jgi:hypothetical protein
VISIICPSTETTPCRFDCARLANRDVDGELTSCHPGCELWQTVNAGSVARKVPLARVAGFFRVRVASDSTTGRMGGSSASLFDKLRSQQVLHG